MGLYSSHWSCSKACFNDYTYCFTTFLVRPSTGAQQSHERAPKNVQMTLKDQTFVNKFKVLFVCLPEVCDLQILGNAQKCLRGNFSIKKYFFLKNLNFVQSFVECKVSLADGTFIH
jgi:hypothetical protein